MIRRGFWLTAGAVTGIYGYRRVSAVGRRLSASLTPGTRPGASGTSLTPRARAGMLRLARETYRFTRDVREGMELYWLAHAAPAGSALSTDHDTQPEDGH
jgi:hypothetical protein